MKSLDARTVVVVDETAMADDANLARLVLAVERTGASLVLVGDHRQLAAIGPGGALTALLQRRPDLAVTLHANIRQHDPAERRALAELRHGSVAAAVGWYASTGRIRTEPTRVDTLVAMVDAWAADTANGHDTALFAWRRADVADLNRLARDRWDGLNQLTGPDVTVTGGHPYAVGDRVVALAPNPGVGIVTSQPLTITALTRDRIQAATDDGRIVTLTGAAIDREHLDYGYAVTVHRAQGATCDRAHLLAAGGGRELAYVALSRARHHTTVHATADDLTQAVEDLTSDWNTEHHQHWITDTPAHPGHQPQPRTARCSDRGAPRRGPPTPPGAGERLPRPARRRRALARHPEGAPPRQLHDARHLLEDSRRRAEAPGIRRRDRRAAAKLITTLTAEVLQAEHRWKTVGQPAADQLRGRIHDVRREIDNLDSEDLIQGLDRLVPTPTPARVSAALQATMRDGTRC